VRIRNNKSLERAGRLAKKHAILAALSKATADRTASNAPAGELNEEIDGYYTMTFEELSALVNGDMPRIESWVGNLDRPHATWLLRWLIKER